MTEGKGPDDECICHILSPPEARSIGGTMKDSIKRAIRTMSGSVRRRNSGGGVRGGSAKRQEGLCVNPSCVGNSQGRGGVVIPLTTTKGGKGIFTTKEPLKLSKPCGGRCGCENKTIIIKHSYANIKIISPDVSSICPCPNSCLNTEALNNIKVTVEHLEVPPKQPAVTVPSEAPTQPEPDIKRRSISELIAAQYNNYVTAEDDQKSFQEDETQFFEE
ncbi:hypothetical protein O0L34_g11919 [Tuta absoluta]|nr:hypothetical protein O0L34_g11919 [Tuta absoluta]